MIVSCGADDHAHINSDPTLADYPCDDIIYYSLTGEQYTCEEIKALRGEK